jgi:hypothetical protein
MSIRSLPDPNESNHAPRDRGSDSGNVIQIICPGCADAILLNPRRIERLRGSFILRCEKCAQLVEVRRQDAVRPIPDDIAELYTAEPVDARPAGWKRILGSRH